MDQDIAIKVEGLGKEYIIGHQKSGDLRNSFNDKLNSLFGRNQEKESFWALKDINFEIKKGEAVGIIGRNGAGKSTLLKILSRITEPTKGRFEINGRVSSLLEVGTGFHSELSGRENIFLNGTILGMTRKEVKKKFDEIVEFSGVSKFIDTPVKHYSSGMVVRLAFSVAAHLEPEILIVDEVLAVGDAEFQKKCIGKMEDVVGNGRTVLFVSHDLNAVQNFCTTGILLNKGKKVLYDEVNKVIESYLQAQIGTFSNSWSNPKEYSHPYFRKISTSLDGRQPLLQLKIVFSIYTPSLEFLPAFVAFNIVNSRGTTVMQAIPVVTPFIKFDHHEQEFEAIIELVGLVPDQYNVSAWIGSHNLDTYNFEREIVGFEVLDSPTKGRTFPHTSEHGSIVPNSYINSIK